MNFYIEDVFDNALSEILEDRGHTKQRFYTINANLARCNIRTAQFLDLYDAEYDCSYYYKYYHDYLFNKDWEFIPFDLIDFKYDCVFVKPDDRCFPGQVLNKKLRSKLTVCNPMCVVSTPKNVGPEYRLLFDRENYITGGLYSLHKALVESEPPPPLVNYISSVIQKVQYFPDDLFVVDCTVTNCQYSIIGLNSFTCSELYGDMNKVADLCEKYYQ